MWLKVVSALANVVIILLAVVLVFVMTKKENFDNSMEAFERRVNNRLEDDRRYLEEKTNRVQQNLDTYQSARESRARIFGDRLDALEKQVRDVRSQQNMVIYNSSNANNGSQVKHREQEQ